MSERVDVSSVAEARAELERRGIQHDGAFRHDLIFHSDIAFSRFNGTEATLLRRVRDLIDTDGYPHPAALARFRDGTVGYVYLSELSDDRQYRMDPGNDLFIYFMRGSYDVAYFIPPLRGMRIHDTPRLWDPKMLATLTRLEA